MKKYIFALVVVSSSVIASATPNSDSHQREHWTGRHGYDRDVPQATVPETTSTLALAAIGLGALLMASRTLRTKRG